jgi:hypothetical protein
VQSQLSNASPVLNQFLFKILPVSRQPSAVSYQLSAISCQLTQFLFKILFPSAVSRQPSAISRQPSAVSHQPSAVSLQPSAVSSQPSAFSRQPSAVSFIMPFGYQPSRSLRSWPPLRYPHYSYPICQKPAKIH